ncbi:sec-domain-containing protein [Pyrenophora seminiperda CCB06]|uniref:Sec-domain-containing protein n=1 Tax=Pyrenophora seminiperda CCB06 TaxID=1302712 RepID=A0A3M7MD24_9PLEO|nr:sec-domain-containing protein [Pyrenophora seminiperda CCB06]
MSILLPETLNSRKGKNEGSFDVIARATTRLHLRLTKYQILNCLNPTALPLFSSPPLDRNAYTDAYHYRLFTTCCSRPSDMTKSKLEAKASTLFDSTDLQHLREYRYQCTYPDPFALAIADDDMELPDPYEYKEFLNFRDRMRPHPHKQVHARKCQHPLHPGHPAVQRNQTSQRTNQFGHVSRLVPLPDYCPMCTLHLHMELLGDLYTRWEAMGGPWATGRLPKYQKDVIRGLRNAFHIRKAELANVMLGVEDAAKAEAHWDQDPYAGASTAISPRPSTGSTEAKRYSATAAFDAYKNGTEFRGMQPPRAASSPLMTPSPSPPPQQSTEQKNEKKKQKKKLSFAADVPCDTQHRSRTSFWRLGGSRYDPGTHACPTDDGWAETAFRWDMQYNIRQCRLLLCSARPQRSRPRQLKHMTYRELTDDHSKDLLVDMVERHVNNLLPKSGEKDPIPNWIDFLTHTTNFFVVWKDEEKGGEESFSTWDTLPKLEGSSLERKREEDDEEAQSDVADDKNGDGSTKGTGVMRKKICLKHQQQ